MNNKYSFLATAGLCVLSFSGCLTVGPDYETPETTMPDAWHAAIREEFSAGTPNLQSWWLSFQDELLVELITSASTNNLDLKTAAARVEQAAALRGVAASQYFPDIVGGGAATSLKTSADQTAAGVDRDQSLYQAGLGMAWELDVWGRVRRTVESADASLLATVEAYRDVLVLLYSEIASSYVRLRTVQEQIAIAQNNLNAQAETMELTQNRFEAGLVPALDVSQAKLNLSRTASVIPPLKQAFVEEVNRLSLLTGDMPYALLGQLSDAQPIPSASTTLAVGLPVDVLRQRPDIRRAERELAAQNARIGAATAELYPALSLPGSLSLETFDAQDLFSGGKTAYSFGPQVRLNLFNGGRIRNQISAEDAATQAALHTYEQTVLLALEEVEDSMAAYVHEIDRVGVLETAAAAADESVRLVTELYKSGLTDFQNVLNMQQALLTQQSELASSRGKVSTDLISIYKSMGGGWNLPHAADAAVDSK